MNFDAQSHITVICIFGVWPVMDRAVNNQNILVIDRRREETKLVLFVMVIIALIGLLMIRFSEH